MPCIQFVSYGQLVEDASALAGCVPSDICAVAGIPRSGMIPASLISTILHVPLLAATTHGLIDLGHGKPSLHLIPRGRVLVVDDSAYRGDAMLNTLAAAGIPRTQLITAVVYAHPHHLRFRPDLIDVFQRVLRPMRFFEWNIFNHAITHRIMSDIDGVICRDPEAAENGSDEYAVSLKNALPYHLPRRTPVHTLISHRLEQWRAVTLEWLRIHGVRHRRLVMAPQLTPEQRRSEMKPYGTWKGALFRDSPCWLFVESSCRQAKIIHRVSGKPVVCIGNGIVYQASPA